VFLGSYATNPASGVAMPILISDYVLSGYGAGAIMAVPAHDQRDYELATEIGLPIVTVSSTGPGPCPDGLSTEDAIAHVVQWLESSGLGAPRTSYKLRDWLFSRQRYWGEPFPIVYDETGLPIALPESMLPVELPPMTDFRPRPAGEDEEPSAPLSRAPGFEFAELDLGDGPRRYRRETNTMPQWAGSCWYYLRYLDPRNDERFVDPAAERFWMAGAGAAGGLPNSRTGGVDLYIGGAEHAVLHLLYARFWHKVLYDLGHVSTPEPFQRLYNQGYILADAFTDPDGRYVPAAEVVQTADGPSYQGEQVIRHSGKMGKSLKNAVSPDEVYVTYGADTLRMYEMSMGPLDAGRPWRPRDIAGVHRFLQRLWRIVVNEETGELRPAARALPPGDPLYQLAHRTIRDVSGNFGELRFNVAIARMMELSSTLAQFVQREGAVPREVAESLVLLTFPLAPHVAAELWEKLGHPEPVDDMAFPVADPDALRDECATVPVTLDGRRRGTITIDRGATEGEAVAAGLRIAAVERLMEGRDVVRVVYVPGTILNLVTRASG
jgi:leucyl-tRNA synthetase